MDAKIINTFLTEGIEAFQTMFGIAPEAKEPHLLDVNAGHPWEISGLLGITGDVRGVVAFRLHKILANKMLELSGIKCKPEEYEDTAIGLVSEFTNIISGRAVSNIKDYSIDISPPFCVMGHNHMIAWPKNYPIIVIPFVTKFGPFEVDVCFK
jgi:chemotaxis protein CheX